MDNKNIIRVNNENLFSSYFGIVISKLRKEKGYTAHVLAKKINVSQQQMSRYERGVNKISVDTLANIAYSLDISVEELFKYAVIEAKYRLRNVEGYSKLKSTLTLYDINNYF